MTASRPATDASADWWEEQGRRAAASVAGAAAAVVVGTDPERAARVAVGIARAESASRRVALGDLAGGLGALYAIAGGEDGMGIADCFRDGLSLSDVARESPDCETLFMLPAGTPPVATRELFAHERWPRLVNGFRESGALLLLVAPIDAPGLDALVAVSGGVIAVGVPAHRVRRWPVLASVAAPEASAPAPDGARRARVMRRATAAVALVCAAALLAWLAWAKNSSPRSTQPGGSVGERDAPPATPANVAAPAVAPPETVDVRERVNPADSLRSALFAVELVAANTPSGANSFVRDVRDRPLPAATVSPVQSGGGSLSYRLVVGAWRSREGADSLLGALRARKVVGQRAGAVVRVPYALLLQGNLEVSRAEAAVGAWLTRRIPAYALLQDDGSVRVFAGAFETPAQAAPLAASLRDVGVTPLVAFRTGRPF